jgi:hypothetical protein
MMASGKVLQFEYEEVLNVCSQKINQLKKSEKKNHGCQVYFN